MAPPLANSTATDGNSQPKIGKQDPSSTSSQDLGQGFNKSHSSIYAMGQSNPDMVAKSQVQDHANLSSKKLYEATSISFKTHGTGKTVTLASTVRLWDVDDIHEFKEVLWRCLLALFGVESMMTSRAKTPQAKLLKAEAIKEFKDKIANIVSALETARTGEAEARASMIKAKAQVKKTPKEKLNESEGQAFLELLCESVDKMSAASEVCSQLEGQLQKAQLEDPSAPKPGVTLADPTLEQKETAQTNNILSSYHEKIQSNSLKDARGFPILSKEDASYFKDCTLYENWDTRSDRAVDEPDTTKVLRPHVYSWIAGCLKGGPYNYMAQLFNTKEQQFDVGGLYARLIDAIGKIGIHGANKRVTDVYTATMRNKETILEFVARIQDMAEKATVIMRDNGETSFTFTTMALQGIVIREGCLHPLYSEQMLKMMRDKPDLDIGDMLKEIRKWQNQIDDLNLAKGQNSRNTLHKNRPTARIATERRTEDQMGCKFWKSYGTCKYGDKCRYTHEEKDKGPAARPAALMTNFPSNPPSNQSKGKPTGGYSCFKCGSLDDHYIGDCTFAGHCLFCIKPENGSQTCRHSESACMKKNPELRAKRDQHKAYGKLICVAPDEVDNDSDDGGEAVRIFNSVLGTQPSACMIRVEREDDVTPAASKMVLRTDGDDYEFELLTEDEMLALTEMSEGPLPNLDDLRKLPEMSDVTQAEIEEDRRMSALLDDCVQSDVDYCATHDYNERNFASLIALRDHNQQRVRQLKDSIRQERKDAAKITAEAEATSQEPRVETEGHQNMRHLPENTSLPTGETGSDVTDDPIAILPAPQIDDLEASNLGD